MSEQSHHTTFSDDPVPQYHYEGMSKSEIVEFEFSRRQLERDAMQGQAVLVGHQAVFDAFRDYVTPIGTPRNGRTGELEKPITPESTRYDLQSESIAPEELEFPADDTDTMQFKIPVDLAAESAIPSDSGLAEQVATDEQFVTFEKVTEVAESPDANEAALTKLSNLENIRQQELRKLMDRLGMVTGDVQSGNLNGQAERLNSLAQLANGLRGLELERQGAASNLLLSSQLNEAKARVTEVILDQQPQFEGKTTEDRLVNVEAAIKQARDLTSSGDARGALMQLDTARGIIDSMIERGDSGSMKLSRLARELFSEQPE